MFLFLTALWNIQKAHAFSGQLALEDREWSFETEVGYIVCKVHMKGLTY